jgi:hypothetical protein
MLPSQNAMPRILRDFFGRTLDHVLILDYVFGNLFKTAPKTLLVQPKTSHPRPIVIAAYINSGEEWKVFEPFVVEAAAVCNPVILINTGTFVIGTVPIKNLFVFSRRNVSRDLGSYRYGLEVLLANYDINAIKSVVLVNDSVVWKQGALKAFIENSEKSAYTVTSITISLQRQKHLQSYAYHVKRPSIEILKPFITLPRIYFKRTLVFYGEMRFSSFWQSQEISFGGLFSEENLLPFLIDDENFSQADSKRIQRLIDSGVHLNPTIHFWKPLYEHSGIIKKSLFKRNPARLDFAPKSMDEVDEQGSDIS